MTMLSTIAVLGAGTLGGAIIDGLLQRGETADGIRATNRTEAKAAALRSENVESFALETQPDANLLAVKDAAVVIIGVKPAMVPDLLREIAPVLSSGAIVISIAAGVTTATMEAIVPNVVIRAMPNTPALVGAGVTGVSAGSRGSAVDMAVAHTLFGSVGMVLEVPESKIDALSAISGSGPAYVFYLIEELTKTAVGLGFSDQEAMIMVNGTFAGSTELLLSGDLDPTELRRRVTSPNGTTERAVAELQKAGISVIFDRATGAALARAKELAAG